MRFVMAQVVKCSRILPRYCAKQFGRVAYLNTPAFQERGSSERTWNSVGLVAGVGLLFLGNKAALAKLFSYLADIRIIIPSAAKKTSSLNHHSCRYGGGL
eukprot:sb/3478720/